MSEDRTKDWSDCLLTVEPHCFTELREQEELENSIRMEVQNKVVTEPTTMFAHRE